MERITHIPEGGEFQDALLQEQAVERWTDEQLIHYHIIEALREDRPIDDATARAIAAQLHGGMASPLYALASSGAVVDGLSAELDTWRTGETAAVEVAPWLAALDEYVRERDDPNPVDGWSGLWPAPPEAVDEYDEAAARQALFERINAAGVTTLGTVATVIGGSVEFADEDQDEHDDFHWVDSARWNPDIAAESQIGERRFTHEELDELFSGLADDEAGTVDDFGWCGLRKHEDRPGGLILTQDDQGVRRVVEAETDEALAARWTSIKREYEAYYEERDAYELAVEGVEDADDLHPRVWVASLADYNAGRLYGVWMDATYDADTLGAATRFMLRGSGEVAAEEWGIFDHDGFYGYNVGEYDSFETVSRVAKGIAEHGEAFAKWVEHVGAEREDLLTDERFQDHYLGKFDSAEAYAEYILEETGSYEYLEQIPESLRVYAKFDTEMMGRDMEIELHVVEASEGGVHVFDPRG